MSETSETPHPEPAPIKETLAKPEKLIGPESAGAQALMLLGIKPPEKGSPMPSVNKEELQRIANGGLDAGHKKNILDGSLNERDEYWKKKGVKEEERMGVWTRQLDGFINKYKNDPKMAEQSEFLKRILGADSFEKVNATTIYETFMQGEGQGNVDFYARRIVETNSQEQIEQNRDLLEKLGKIFGENSAKISGLLAYGIANGRRNPGEFATSADTQLKKGDFGDRGIWEKLEKNSSGWGDKEIKRLAVEHNEKQIKEEQEKELQKLREKATAESGDDDKKDTPGDRVIAAGEKAKAAEAPEKKEGADTRVATQEKADEPVKESGEKVVTPESLSKEIDEFSKKSHENELTAKILPVLEIFGKQISSSNDVEFLHYSYLTFEILKKADESGKINKKDQLIHFTQAFDALSLCYSKTKDAGSKDVLDKSMNLLTSILETENIVISDLKGEKFDKDHMIVMDIEAVEAENEIGTIRQGHKYSIDGTAQKPNVILGVSKQDYNEHMEAMQKQIQQ